jgi:type IV pilus assembly protein PilV
MLKVTSRAPAPPREGDRRRRQRGVSLIEVMVAILVASAGILAMAGLLGVAARFGKTTEFRSLATLLAADLGDRMRANKQGKALYVLKNTTLAAGGATEAAACANVDLCTIAELAAIDLAAWQRNLFNSLPSGTGFISAVDANDTFDVWVVWTEPDALSDSNYLNSFDTGKEAAQGCPPGFDIDPVPRCMFFRVGL